MLLDQAQQARYQQQGYLHINQMLTAAEVEKLRQEVDALYAQPSDGTRHHLSLSADSELFAQLAKDTRIVDVLRSLIGQHIQLQHSKLAVKPSTPGTGLFGMHQDFSYYPHSNSDLCSAFIALDDCTPENGCMYMLPGSHKWGLLNHHQDGVFTGTCMETDRWSETDKQALIMKTGDISFHHCLCMHGSPVNKSGKSRRAVVFSYRAADAYQLAGHIFPDTGVQICGQRSNTVRMEATELALPQFNMYEHEEPFGGSWQQLGSITKNTLKEQAENKIEVFA